LGGSSHKQFIAIALWRIATPFDAGAIHPIRKAGLGAGCGQFAESCHLMDREK
jgi:hypothetical protein